MRIKFWKSFNAKLLNIHFHIGLPFGLVQFVPGVPLTVMSSTVGSFIFSLIYFLGFSQLNAQGTSLALIMFPVGILAVINYYKQGHIDFNIVFILAIGFVIGSFLGSKFAMNIPQEIIKKCFAILMIYIAFKMLFSDKKDLGKNTNNHAEILNNTKSI